MAPVKVLDTWIKAVVFNLLIAGCIGVLLRMAFVVEFEWMNYRYFLHAHSHTAMLGWIYGAIFILIVRLFNLDVNRYNKLFWLTQFSVVGMLLSFMFQGYGVVSIAFSTLHILSGYHFVRLVYNDLKGKEAGSLSKKFLLTSFFFLILSTVAVWSMGPLMMSVYKGTAVYYATAQFFLHFQFNGWFIFAVIALTLKFLENHKIEYNVDQVKKAYLLLVVSCILTYSLAVTWSTPEKMLFWINSIGVVLQLFGLILFVRGIKEAMNKLKALLRRHTVILWFLAFVGLVLKIVVQTLVAIPDIAKISYTIHNFVIGFIHLLMLACLSMFIFGAFANIRSKAAGSRLANAGFGVFITGVISSELLLFFQGILLWFRKGFITNYYELIVAVSILIPIGVLMYLVSVFTTSRYVT